MKSQALMTEGSIGKSLCTFTIPLFLGNLFQQLYNTADSLIVGNFLGHNALAAVSATSNLIFLLVGFINGISLGAGVVIAQQFGAKRYHDMQNTIHTMIALGIIASIILMTLGTLFAPQILRWMNTPADVLSGSAAYLQIYFAGSIGLIMYNIFVGILQSIGDSRHPLYYLILSSITNVILDITFIKAFHWGVWSAAVATVISQCLSAVFCFIQLNLTKEPYHVYIRKIRFHKNALAKIIRYGIPSGVQNSMIGFSNVVVQANINVFGEMAMAGCGAYQKIEGFGLLPMTSLSMAITTFVGQNVGAREFQRAKKGAKIGLLSSMILAEIIGAIVFLCAPILIAAFNDTPQVMQFGVQQARTIGLFYLLPAATHCFAAIFRGTGKPILSMAVILACWCLVRVTILIVVLPLIPSIQIVYWVYPFTWFLSSIIFLFCYLKSNMFQTTENNMKQI